MKFVEPLGVYFADARDATLNGAAIKVHFDDAYQQELNIVEGINPQVTVRATDAANVVHGAVLVIAGIGSFKVREVQPDVDGIIVLQLSTV